MFRIQVVLPWPQSSVAAICVLPTYCNDGYYTKALLLCEFQDKWQRQIALCIMKIIYWMVKYKIYKNSRNNATITSVRIQCSTIFQDIQERNSCTDLASTGKSTRESPLSYPFYSNISSVRQYAAMLTYYALITIRKHTQPGLAIISVGDQPHIIN